MQNYTKIADVQIAGLELDSVSRGVRSALNCIRGVGVVSMQPEQRLVRVTYDACKVSPCQIERAVRVMGGEVERLVVRNSKSSAVERLAHLSIGSGWDG